MRARRLRFPSRSLPTTAVVVATMSSLVACGPSSPPPSPGSEAVRFESADGIELEGRLFEAEGATAGVVLAHMRPADQRSWFGFADTLADEGYRALTFNFRGYCPGDGGGCSDGQIDPPSLWQDVLGAVRFLRSTGVPRVAVIGASMGGTAALVAAAETDARIGAVATLSAPRSFEGLEATPEMLVTMGAAKLFVAGNGDAAAAADAQSMYEGSVPPKRVEILPSEDHGTDLLDGNQGPNVRQLLLGWLARFLPVRVSDREDA